MGIVNGKLTRQALGKILAPVALALSLVATSAHADFTVNVVDQTGVPVSGFKWVLEEDTTFPVTPGVPTQDTLSINFHKSYAPVVSTGEELTSSSTIITSDPAKPYFISVLPFTGHQMNGKKVDVAQATVTITVNTMPIPTAQVSILIFPDFYNVNGVYDLPQEVPQLDPTLPDYNGFDPTKFEIQVHDSAGQVSTDAFGNPFNTTYNADGSVNVLGDGILRADINGRLDIRNLAPGKWGIKVVPPAGETWQQTSTIEGGPAIDAFVAANEPSWFVEFGPPGQHVFIGFVKPTDAFAGGIGSSISGTIVNQHMTRPPAVGFYPGNPFPNCWVALQPLLGAAQAYYIQPCNPDSTFTINNVPDGTYQMVIWDSYLNILIANRNVTVAGTNLALGDVQVFNWFSRFEAVVYSDTNQNGIRDPGELGIPEQNINLRFRDGRIYQAFPTDLEGAVPFDEVFPFFHWLVAEVDYTKLKATGATYVVDGGGLIQPQSPSLWDHPSRDKLNPQAQPTLNPLTLNNLSTTIQGPALTFAFQSFLGTTNLVEFGKAPYNTAAGENGGISGVIVYAVTRAENDPAYAAAEPWEPGVPRVQVNLYTDNDNNNIIDDTNLSGFVEIADVDNYPFGWLDGTAPKGIEDVDHNGDGFFDFGDAIQITKSDSWDDSVPTGCVGDVFIAHPGTPIEKVTDCFDGFRNFNQVREGVYDGGYIFNNTTPGFYIVEAAMPPGYQILKEEDKNVDFGVEFVPSPLLLPPACVGDLHTIPPILSFQTDSTGALLPGIDPILGAIAAPYAGTNRPYCDKKKIVLTAGKNAAADFHVITPVPAAAHVTGTSLDDLSNEFDPNAPTFGEKYGIPWMPVVFRDWTGEAITTVYTDQYGRYNGMLPSTFSINVPSPTGVSANMLAACMNDPNPTFNVVTGLLEPDPFHKANYSTTCYTFDYTPAATTYLDTPVVPVAAFAGPNQFPVDCALPDKIPGIYTVNADVANGPYIPPTPTLAQRTLTITSRGLVVVPNPNFDGTNATPATITRDYGFGAAQGSVQIGNTPLTITSWSDTTITAEVPAVVPPTGTLTVTNSLGVTSQSGVTVTTDLPATAVHYVASTNTLAGTPIQTAIDAANPGDLILIQPGYYYEMVIMHKPVKLQGYGASATTINAVKQPRQKLIDWRMKLAGLLATQAFDLVPGQTPLVQIVPSDPILFASEEGAPVLVISTDATKVGRLPTDEWSLYAPRIDGLTLTGSDLGSGILVNGYAHGLEISNNKIAGNSGSFAGGIKIGDSLFTGSTNNVNIHNNEITQNGATGGSGGGVAVNTGTNNYTISKNLICGNFTQGNGAGIGHEGFSDNGTIIDNTIVFNQSFSQLNYVSGGGIFIGGIPAVGTPSPGTGSVRIEGNHIEGNLAGAGSGGGIRLSSVNGLDVASGSLNTISIYDNVIVGNVAGNAGGGISLLDAASVKIKNNTIAHNDSTATTGVNFINASQTALQRGAGIAAEFHTAELLGTGIGSTYSNPELVNNIIWQNRSFYWTIDTTVTPAVFGLVPIGGVLNLDVAVLGGELAVPPVNLNPVNSVLTSLTNNSGGLYDASNTVADPAFFKAFNNGGRDTALVLIGTAIGTAPALDEGGNFIDVRFGPLSMVRDYHLARSNSSAINLGLDTSAEVGADIDGDVRPVGGGVDAGADEASPLTDTDGDTVFDRYDNCTLVANTNQIDADGDGYGNRCDPDLNNDGAVNTGDLNILRSVFFTSDPVADLNVDGSVNTGDLNIMRSYFFLVPGPSGIAP